MGRTNTPYDFGQYASQAFALATRDGSPWWNCHLASALLDLSRLDGYVTALAGIMDAMRHCERADWIARDVPVESALKVALDWLDAEIPPREVGGWLRAGCCNPAVARKLATAGIRPSRLLDETGYPLHWLDLAPGRRVPLALAVAEWGLPVSDAVLHVVGRSDRVMPNKYRRVPG